LLPATAGRQETRTVADPLSGLQRFFFVRIFQAGDNTMAIFINNEKPSPRRNRLSMLFLVLFIICLYAFQSKVIVPFVEYMASSDFFDINTDGIEGKDVSGAAYEQCDRLAIEQDPSVANVAKGDFRYWETGGGKYLVNSRNYTCNIRYLGGDPQDGNSWSLNGMEMHAQ
jgi:hypothetical protein